MKHRQIKTICYILPIQIMSQSYWRTKDGSVEIIGKYNGVVYALDTRTCELIIRSITQTTNVYQYTLFYILAYTKQTKPVYWLSEPRTITMNCNIDGLETNQHTIIIGLSEIELSKIRKLKSRTNIMQVAQTIRQNLGVDITTEHGVVVPIVYSMVRDVQTFRLD